MKHFLLIIFSIVSLNSFAQNANEGNNSYYCYCIMQAKGTWGSALKGYIDMDMNGRYTICDKNNKPMGFQNYIQIVNLMSKVGWEYVRCENIGSDLDFILKKKVSNDQEAKDGLNLLTDEELKKAKK